MTSIVCLNGTFLPADQTRIDPTDRGFTLGDGVFDTMLAVNGEPVDGKAHGERLTRHAGVLGIENPIADVFVSHAVQLLHRNGLAGARAAIRTTLTRGPGARGLLPPAAAAPTVMMQAFTAPAYEQSPLRLIIAQSVRRNDGSPLSRIKSLNYGDQILALQEAAAGGANDAILLNNRGGVCCATTSNIFVLIDGEWLTPPLEDGVLDGITRAALVATGRARVCSIDATRLAGAEAIALSNSIAGIAMAASLEGKPLDAGAPLQF